MAHFADGKWNAVTGLVAAASGAPAQPAHSDPTTTAGGVASTGVDLGTPALFTNSATPGALATFNVPRAGMYAIMFYLKTQAAGTGAGQTCAIQAAYNDGTAVSATSLPGNDNVAPQTQKVTLDALTLNAIFQGGKQLFCAAGSQIVLTLVGAGTITTPASVQAYWAIEAV